MSVTFQSKFDFYILFFQYSVFKMERCTADDISVSYDPTISSSIEFKTKWKDTMHTLHVRHKNLLKRFVAGRSILNITIYDFFHCVVLVRVAGLRMRCFFLFRFYPLYFRLLVRSGQDGGDHGWPWHDGSLHSHQTVLEHLVLSDQSLGKMTAVKMGKRHVKLISITVIFHETNVIRQETTWCRL